MKSTKSIFLAGILLLLGSHYHIKAQDMKHHLDKREQKIVTIAAYTATGNLDGLKNELNSGLDAGLTINETKEILVQMYAYAGFPRSLQGINTFMSVLEERRSNGIEDIAGKEASPIPNNAEKYERGKQTLETLTGRKEGRKEGRKILPAELMPLPLQ